MQLREQLNLILTLQNTISEQDREISAVVGKIDETLERLRGRLFQRDGLSVVGSPRIARRRSAGEWIVCFISPRGIRRGVQFLAHQQGTICRSNDTLHIFACYRDPLEEAGRERTQEGRDNSGIASLCPPVLCCAAGHSSRNHWNQRLSAGGRVVYQYAFFI